MKPARYGVSRAQETEQRADHRLPREAGPCDHLSSPDSPPEHPGLAVRTAHRLPLSLLLLLVPALTLAAVPAAAQSPTEDAGARPGCGWSEALGRNPSRARAPLPLRSQRARPLRAPLLLGRTRLPDRDAAPRHPRGRRGRAAAPGDKRELRGVGVARPAHRIPGLGAPGEARIGATRPLLRHATDAARAETRRERRACAPPRDLALAGAAGVPLPAGPLAPGPTGDATLTSWHSQVNERGEPAARAADYDVVPQHLARFHQIAHEVGLDSFGADSNDPGHVFLPNTEELPPHEIPLLQLLPRVPVVTLASGRPDDERPSHEELARWHERQRDFLVAEFVAYPAPELALRHPPLRPPVATPEPGAAPAHRGSHR